MSCSASSTGTGTAGPSWRSGSNLPGPIWLPLNSRITDSISGGRGARRSRRQAGEAIDELRAEGLRIEEDALDALFSYIDLPLEFTAASEYCDRRGAHLFLVDMDRFSSVNLSRMDELIAKENLRMLLGSDQGRGGRQKAMARLFLEKGIKTFPYTEEMRLRDRHMSKRIGHLVKRHAPSRVVHICGWQHLCDPFGLYTALYPKKAFIYDKAQGA